MTLEEACIMRKQECKTLQRENSRPAVWFLRAGLQACFYLSRLFAGLYQ